MNSIRIVLLGFLTHDLSNEHDLRAHQEKAKWEGAASISINTSWGSILKNSFSFDVIFLLSHTVFSGVLGAFIGRTLPLVVDTLHYDNLALDMCFIGESVSMTIISILIGVAKPHSLGVYVCGVVSLIAFVIAQLCLFLLPRGMSEGFNVFLLVALVLSYAVNWITDQTFSIVTLGKLVPSEVQSSIEGVRMVLHLGGSFGSSLGTAYIYKSFHYVFYVTLPSTFLLLVLLTMRRGTLSNPCVKYDSKNKLVLKQGGD